MRKIGDQMVWFASQAIVRIFVFFGGGKVVYSHSVSLVLQLSKWHWQYVGATGQIFPGLYEFR